MRNCDDCTVCCYITKVPELEKSERTDCNHCNKNKGCKIYSDRPKSCAKFECAWLQGMFDEEDKPSISGVLVENHKTFLLASCENDEWIKMHGKFDEYVKKGIPVVINTTKKNFCGKPSNMTDQEVWKLMLRTINGSGIIRD